MSVSPAQQVDTLIEEADPDEDTLREWSGSPIAEYLSEIVRTPGFHDAGDGCDTIIPTGFCEHGHVQFGAEQPCRARGCPHHWTRWRRERVRSMVERLAAARYLAGDGIERRMVHLSTAPPQDRRWTTELLWEFRSRSYEIAREVGATGAYAITHAYRVSDAGDELYQDWLGGAVAQDRGKWSALRDYADDWDEMKPLVDVAPHYHHIALAEDVDGDTAEAVEEEAGWVSTNIRSLAPFYADGSEVEPYQLLADGGRITRSRSEVVAEGYGDMVGLAMYVLEHGAVQPRTGDLPQRSSVTAWGDVHSVTPAEDLPAEVWAAIQRGVEAALPGVGDDEGDEERTLRCARDGCEEPVRPLSDLPDRLADPDHSWWDALDFAQQCELLGVDQYMSDKPPPGVGGDLPPGGFGRSPDAPPGVESAEDWIEWLRRLGRRRIERDDPALLTAGV